MGILLLFILLLQGISVSVSIEQKLLSRLLLLEAEILYENAELTVFKPIKGIEPIPPQAYTCIKSTQRCFPGIPLLSDGNELLIKAKGIVRINLNDGSTKKLNSPLAYATVGKDKKVHIRYGDKVIRVEKGIPKKWVYPKELEVLPCGEGFWINRKGYYVFINSEGKLVERGRGKTLCIMGKLVSKGKRVSFQPEKRTLIKVGSITGLKLNSKIKLFPEHIIVIEGSRLLLLDRNLSLLRELSLQGIPQAVLYLEGKYYLTLRTSEDTYELLVVESFPQGKSYTAVRVKSSPRRRIFLPFIGENFLMVIPPEDVCLVTDFLGTQCLKMKYYPGYVYLMSKSSMSLDKIKIPERSKVILLNKHVTYCPEKGTCLFVTYHPKNLLSSMEIRTTKGECSAPSIVPGKPCIVEPTRLHTLPLSVKGLWSSDNFRILPWARALSDKGEFLIFNDANILKVPEGCRVRKGTGTIFCIEGERKASLRDISNTTLLGSTEGIPYPEHVYRSKAVLKLWEDIAVVDAKRKALIGRISSPCGQDKFNLLFNKDLIYAVATTGNGICMEAFRIAED